MQIHFDEDDPIAAELAYMVQLHRKHGAPNPHESVESLVRYVLSAIADGSRRPGCWERQCLEMMGLVAECEEHQSYRAGYGDPAKQ